MTDTQLSIICLTVWSASSHSMAWLCCLAWFGGLIYCLNRDYKKQKAAGLL
jgi:hypothetical protein